LNFGIKILEDIKSKKMKENSRKQGEVSSGGASADSRMFGLWRGK
jgi:hypothetical protein